MRPALPVLLLLAACGGGAAAPDGGPDGAPRPDAGPFDPPAGEIQIVEVRTVTGDYPSASARIVEGGLPVFQTETMREGDCHLLAFEQALCADPCTGICVPPGTCVPWPHYASVGTLAVTGVKHPLTFGYDGGYGYYLADASFPDLFDPGDEVTVTAPGDELGGFTVHAAAGAVAAGTPVVDGAITIPNHADYTFGWTPAGDGSEVRLTINANNHGHGAPYDAILVCEAPDDAGQLVIPSAMIDAFPETQAWQVCAGSDCPPSTFARYHRGTASLGAAGEVQLLVGGVLSFGVNHAAP